MIFDGNVLTGHKIELYTDKTCNIFVLFLKVKIYLKR